MADEKTTCRMSRPADADALVALFLEMEQHYWGAAAAPPPADTEHYVRTQVLTGCEIAVAEQSGRVVAFATFGLQHPGADCGGTLYMKDIYTTADARGQGMGHCLMRFLAREALTRGCTRFDWTTQDKNSAARTFYERLGAQPVTDKVYYRLRGDALRALAEYDSTAE